MLWFSGCLGMLKQLELESKVFFYISKVYMKSFTDKPVFNIPMTCEHCITTSGWKPRYLLCHIWRDMHVRYTPVGMCLLASSIDYTKQKCVVSFGIQYRLYKTNSSAAAKCSHISMYRVSPFNNMYVVILTEKHKKHSSTRSQINGLIIFSLRQTIKIITAHVIFLQTETLTLTHWFVQHSQSSEREFTIKVWVHFIWHIDGEIYYAGSLHDCLMIWNPRRLHVWVVVSK